MPSAYSTILFHIPTTVTIRIEIGPAGKARTLTLDKDVPAMRLQLEAYFKEKARYRESCDGEAIEFTIHYVRVEPESNFSISEVRFRPPDQFFVFYHQLKPSLDPVRSKPPQKRAP